MQIESLTGLRAAFEDWRSRKRHAREAVPAALLERAREAVRRHGPAEVSRATKVCRSRLKIADGGRRRSKAVVAGEPTFSRMELTAPVADRAFVELETATGLKVRLVTTCSTRIRALAAFGGSASPVVARLRALGRDDVALCGTFAGSSFRRRAEIAAVARSRGVILVA